MTNRVLTVLQLAQLICKGALARKESRGAHFRKDFPEMVDEYSRNYVHQLVDSDIVSTWKAVPAPSKRLEKGLEEFARTKHYGHSE